MEQPRREQPALLSDQLPGGSCHDDFRCGVPEPLQHDPWRHCCGARVHGVCVGSPQQRHSPADEEAVSHNICHGGHVG